jgi:hypothetical protein
MLLQALWAASLAVPSYLSHEEQKKMEAVEMEPYFPNLACSLLV